MELERHPHAAAFLAEAQAEIERDEVAHSLALGVAQFMASVPGTGADESYFATVRDGDALVLAAMNTPERPLLLVDLRDDAEAAFPALLDDLRRSEWPVRTVLGHEPLAEAFARLWADAAGVEYAVAMRERLHALTEVRPVPSVPGALRPATEDDLDLVVEWIGGFYDDVFGDADEGVAGRGTAPREAAGRIGRGEIYLWDDGGPRTMAGRGRPTRHTEAVNAVYTPRELRGRGYATAAVAELSRRLLAEGRTACVLFTDLANPTSNAIYARIGYRPVRDMTMFRVAPRGS